MQLETRKILEDIRLAVDSISIPRTEGHREKVEMEA